MKSRLGLSVSDPKRTTLLNDSPVDVSIRNQNSVGNISASEWVSEIRSLELH